MNFVFYNLNFYYIIFYNFNLCISHCKSYTEGLTTVPYIGDDGVAWRLFRTSALSDDGPVRTEKYRNFCKLERKNVCILLV